MFSTVEREVGAEVADDEEGRVGEPGRKPDVRLARVVRRPVLADDDAEGGQADDDGEDVGRGLKELHDQDVGLKLRV